MFHRPKHSKILYLEDFRIHDELERRTANLRVPGRNASINEQLQDTHNTSGFTQLWHQGNTHVHLQTPISSDIWRVFGGAVAACIPLSTYMQGVAPWYMYG